MNESDIRTAIRAARRGAAMTQASLAESSGISRVTIARIESGTGGNVRLRTLQALCRALGLELSARPQRDAQRAATGLHRARARASRLDLRRRHALVATMLLTVTPAEARSLILRARKVVDRWERDGLCSHHYIERWRHRLGGSPKRVARALCEEDDWTDALLQNSPWSFALGPPSK